MNGGLITVLASVCGISGLILLVAAVLQIIEDHDSRCAARDHAEVVQAVKLRRVVADRVLRLTDAEYDDAVLHVIRKYHMADKHGNLDLHNQNPEYVAMLIAKTAEQTRLFKETLAIAQADSELNPKPENEMEVITA
jgi:hypothetical protein